MASTIAWAAHAPSGALRRRRFWRTWLRCWPASPSAGGAVGSCVLDRLVDALVKGRDLLVEHIHQRQMLRQHKGVVWLQRAAQRLLQLGLLGAQATLGQVRQRA